ncbi:MAG: HAD-IA family hydrolase [Alphaproteobacteria bacterium]
MTRLVIFDCDGTIVDSQHLIHAAMVETFETAGLIAPPNEVVRRVVGLRLDEAIARLLPEGDAHRAEAMAEAYKASFQRLRSDPATPQDTLYPSAYETIAALARNGYLLGVATGKSRRGLRVTLERHGLIDFFVTLQTVDDAPGKPDPAMVRQAMAEAGAAPHETVVIGDTVFDMMMAANAGVRALGVAWGYHEPEELRAAGAIALVGHFAELPGSLARWQTMEAEGIDAG